MRHNLFVWVTLFILTASATQAFAFVAGFGAVPTKSSVNLDPSPGQASLLTIDNLRFGQELLWSVWLQKVDGSIYPSLVAAAPSESLVVYFAKSADGKFVHMFERGGDADVLGDALIDRFPVVSSDTQQTTFDFSQGLPHRLFRTWIAPEYLADFKISYASVYDFKNEDDVVTFAELAKLDDAKYSTVIMRHAFRLFAPNLGFVTVKIPHPDQHGFFAASSLGEPNSEEPQAIRHFDSRKPLIWYISSNTPAQFVPALREGMLWWNQAFGREYIKVEVLKGPVAWADARINILQWSQDPAACGEGGTIALGPSEVNPESGEIYSGKILLCGTRAAMIYDMGVDKTKYTRTQFEHTVFAWTAAHELGHTLGFTHNFKGKAYRDPAQPQILSSSVMDYPVPQEFMSFNAIGPADIAKVGFAYLNPGDQSALAKVDAFPFCTDEQAPLDPECNRFVEGNKNADELAAEYLDKLTNGATLLPLDHMVRGVIAKKFFIRADELSLAQTDQLLKLYPGSKSALVGSFREAGEGAKSLFLGLEPEKQSRVLSRLRLAILDENLKLELPEQKSLIDTLNIFRIYPAYAELGTLKYSIEAEKKSTVDARRLTQLYKLGVAVDKVLAAFWEE